MIPSKNHHGFIVTSPRGSVSLTDLPVPRHETHGKAAKWGRDSGKPFVIVPAAQFFRTSFGRMVRALEHKKALARPELTGEHLVVIEAIEEASLHRKPSALTNLLSRMKQAAQDRRLNEKAKADTPKPLKASDIIARQMRTVGEALDESRKRLADRSHLAVAMRPPPSNGILHASDSDLATIFFRMDAKAQHLIDVASKFRWTPTRVNKLIKSKTLVSFLVLFRAGRLPDKCRTHKILLSEVNK